MIYCSHKNSLPIIRGTISWELDGEVFGSIYFGQTDSHKCVNQDKLKGSQNE